MKFWIFLLILFSYTSLFSQAILDAPLRCSFKNEPIKKNGIKSLVVFAEINDAGIEKHGGRSGKILEFEFDSTGYMSYRLSLNKLKKMPFIPSQGNNRFEYFSFNEQGKIQYLHRENENAVYQFIQEFDSNGNLIQYVALDDDDIMSNVHFKWDNGKMIEFVDQSMKDEGDHSKSFYDDLGRVSQFKDVNNQILFEYEQNGDTINTTRIVRGSNGIISIETYAYLEQLEHHLISYSISFEDGEVETKMNVSYDTYGNATKYDLIEGLELRDIGGVIETHYRIENIYDVNELLVTRKFYSTQNDSETELMVRVERYIYDSESLIFKFEKCDLHKYY